MNKYFFSIFFFLLMIPDFQSLKAQRVNDKKLIEFGWDYPKVSYLKSDIMNMRSAPFDGVVFSFDFDIYNAFDDTERPLSDFQYDDLAKIQWGGFTDNFLFVRGASYSGAHWLDDKSWLQISRNLKRVSEALKISKAKGIGFDPEYYYNDSTLNPWVYRASWYHNLSYQEVGNYVRKRGKQFIQALQANKPDVKILCFWLLDLVDMQSQTQTLSKTGMALYPFFIEGMLQGKNKISEIIDGNESSYWYQKPDNFVLAGEYLHKRRTEFIRQSLWPKLKDVTLAPAIYFDWIYAKIPEYNKGLDSMKKAQWLKDNLYYAYKTSDKYVWFYNERVNWWNRGVDAGVLEIIQNVRLKINIEQNNSASQIDGYSIGSSLDEKNGERHEGFSFSYLKAKNQLKIRLFDKTINTIDIYNNSMIVYSLDNPPTEFNINLNNKYDKIGNLIILGKNPNGTTSISFVN